MHVQGLHDDKSLADNAERIVGYAAKLKLSTTLSDGDTRPWPLETVTLFVASCMRCSHGRQAFKLVIQPKMVLKTSKASFSKINPYNLEPMPVVV